MILQIIEIMKDEIGGKLMAEFATLQPKTYSYLVNDNEENKKGKSTKKMT